jgi:hypothetical protein
VKLVQIVAHVSQPFGLLHDCVKVVTMDDPQMLSIRSVVNRLFDYFDTPKLVVLKIHGQIRHGCQAHKSLCNLCALDAIAFEQRRYALAANTNVCAIATRQ